MGLESPLSPELQVIKVGTLRSGVTSLIGIVALLTLGATLLPRYAIFQVSFFSLSETGTC